LNYRAASPGCRSGELIAPPGHDKVRFTLRKAPRSHTSSARP